MKSRHMSHIQIIALGYFLMIAVGTALLMLPVASRSGRVTDFLTALLTATSASCVTGLVMVDTATYWSLFGQLVIILLIQIGGLGFMTIATFFSRLVYKRAGLRERAVMAESINAGSIGAITSITKKIITGTCIFELSGALLLSIRFIPMFGLFKGIYYSFFHAISAFCNAGFDLMGGRSGKFSSLVSFSGDPLVSITVMLLIIIGGIGFLVWDDVLGTHFRFKRFKLHTKLTVTATAILIFGGAVLLYLFELKHTGAGKPVGEQLLCAFFGSVTARTAGFNTTDTAAMSSAAKLLTIIFMFIGGSSGSTAGGVKTTGVAVVLIYIAAAVRGLQTPHAFGRRLHSSAFRKAVIIIGINLLLALTGTLIICANQQVTITDSLFEAFSAIGTVGMTTGITRELTPVSQGVIIFLMYCGRVGSISFAAALLEKRVIPPVAFPAEDVTVG